MCPLVSNSLEEWLMMVSFCSIWIETLMSVLSRHPVHFVVIFTTLPLPYAACATVFGGAGEKTRTHNPSKAATDLQSARLANSDRPHIIHSPYTLPSTHRCHRACFGPIGHFSSSSTVIIGGITSPAVTIPRPMFHPLYSYSSFGSSWPFNPTHFPYWLLEVHPTKRTKDIKLNADFFHSLSLTVSPFPAAAKATASIPVFKFHPVRTENECESSL